MASIRTIKIGKAELKWNTGMIRSLYFDHPRIVGVYKNVVKPRLQGKIKKHSEIRSVICNMLEEVINSGEIKTMLDWVNVVMALRLTEIDELNMEEDGFRIRLLIPDVSQEKKTFWNIAWHMNHHCKQLYKCCFVQVYGSYASIYGRVALSYTTGEVHDRKDYFLDKHYERDRNPGFYKNRNGEWSI